MPFVKLEQELRLPEFEAIEIVTKTFVLPDTIKYNDCGVLKDLHYDYNRDRYFAEDGFSVSPKYYVKSEVLPKAKQEEKERLDF